MKDKKCRICGKIFQPFSSTQRVCSPACAISMVNKKKSEEKRKERRKKTQEYYEKDKSFQRTKAQKSFNRYIRERDRYALCISCGKWHNGQWHAGHYRTTKAASQLRFNEDNCHKQCAPCNNHLSGNIVEYRINLIKKIGLERVEALENSHEIKKYTLEDYYYIIDTYKRKLKELLDRRN